MVKNFLYLLCFFSLIMEILLEATPSVDASIDSATSQAHFPLQGSITITHSKEEKIDPQSFTIEGKPLEVSIVKDVKLSAASETLLTIYNFQIPAQNKGLYILPSISLKIDGLTYHTNPSTYEVQEETEHQISSPSEKSSSPLTFRLQASIQGPSTLYPGERTKLLYRISYNRSIDLTRSEFPMIHPAHFQKVGDVQVRDYQLKDVTVQDLTQEIEASELGTFSFGPSLVEGYAYTMEAGQKVYDPTLLKAQAPIVTLEVKPFPKSTQPASFTGALGQIQAESILTSSNAVSVGDTLQFQVSVQGVKNLEELRLPSLQCQPGFSGFFQMSDLPPLAEVKEKQKLFYMELRPMTSLIHQIPSIEVSSFDTKTGKYVIQQTLPISVTINASALENPSMIPIPSLTPFAFVDNWPAPLLSPLEIEGNGINQYQMTHSLLKSVGIFWMIPIGCFLLLLQKYLQKQWKQRSKSYIPESEKTFKYALSTGNLQLLERAFWYRLWEKGKIPENSFQIEKLPDEEKLSAIRLFLYKLQALQYSENKTFDLFQLKQNAKQLFAGIR